jgi:hypothetical protein
MPIYYYLSYLGVTHRLIIPDDVAEAGERFKQFTEQILGVDQFGKVPDCYVTAQFIPELSDFDKRIHERYGNIENLVDY